MARNKYPEKTVERILDVATKLFWEKGYENTSVQDILNQLQDLTKGAIYHHFKSKEDIFDAVVARQSQTNAVQFVKIKNNSTLSGSQKLKEMVQFGISSDFTKKVFDIAPNLLDNPKLLAIQLKQIQDVITPQFIFPIIQQGIQDGSIVADKPYELAEVIAILLNVWLNPLILGQDIKRFETKCQLIDQLLQPYCIQLFD